MHQRKWLRAAFVLTGLAVALTAQESVPQTYQPGQVIKVTPHRSRWDYPKEITLPENSQLHIVETGDTLWDLGNKYLGNPFSWPQIWEQNKWITDPHWIYPGDHLIIPVGRTSILPGETPSEVEVAPGSPRTYVRPTQDEYAFTFQDFIQMPYLVSNGAYAHFQEIGAFEIKSQQATLHTQLGDFENIYINGGSANGLKEGDRLIVLKVVKYDLVDPAVGRQSMGDVVKQIGVVRLTQVQPGASVGVIEKSADSIQVGDYIAPFSEPANMTVRLRTDVKPPITIKDPDARILYVGQFQTVSGTGEMVIVNRGTADGMKVGDVLLAARQKSWTTDSGEAQTNYLIGQLLVVKTMENSVTCRILRAYEEITVGDVVTH